MSTNDEKISTSTPVIWITGASQGIGKAVAMAMAREGMIVAASARNAAQLEVLAKHSAELQGNIIPYPLDVTDQNAVHETVNKIIMDHGQINQAILNAGTYIATPAAEFTSSAVRQQVELNLMGVCHCIEPLISIMKTQGKGIIAINASLAGYRGLPKAAGYGATKAALINMAESLHSELSEIGIDIKVINPGFVKTPLTSKNRFPMPFIMEVEKAAEIIVKGMKARQFEIRFPRVFAAFLGILRRLPYPLYFWLIRKTN
ncbi:SDR family NAD(P)-dependent oxidoreductase [Endozoicomonas elysicola]|uniref:Oxidoreductase n=1 Tax=Endozoicomonas elysicola TaxID=305900 RepID=A0A081K7K7_9GAMM|nr:SDR family NAD(P)-dependent oxidoreductase [Endozoicomonas elysicola]KEI70133.1 oxidoreductase [Endozoicomonas elysicola]